MISKHYKTQHVSNCFASRTLFWNNLLLRMLQAKNLEPNIYINRKNCKAKNVFIIGVIEIPESMTSELILCFNYFW